MRTAQPTLQPLSTAFASFRADPPICNSDRSLCDQTPSVLKLGFGLKVLPEAAYSLRSTWTSCGQDGGFEAALCPVIEPGP